MKKYKVTNSHFCLDDYATDDMRYGSDQKELEKKTAKNIKKIFDLQQKMYAEKKEGLILVFQAMDAAGKDGTIRAVLKSLAPQGVKEVPFKAPSAKELSHDFLWRVHKEVPARGEIAIFNRSHYEDVLIVAVKELYKDFPVANRIDRDKIIEKRYKQIRQFEQYLYDNSITVVKFFLHVSKEEQALRFLDRIDEERKNWKFSDSDYKERAYWDQYQEAFEKCIRNTATKNAPWYVIPADTKWYMRYVVSQVVLNTLKKMAPAYPELAKEDKKRLEQYRLELSNELKI